MIEIALLIVLGMQFRKMAEAKGRPASWGLLALVVPGIGWTIAFIGGFVIAAATGSSATIDSPYFFPLLGVVYGTEILVAVILWQIMKRLKPGSLPIPAAAPAQATAAPAVGQALAGVCDECGQAVWLEPDGSCPNGHPATSISGTYWALKG